MEKTKTAAETTASKKATSKSAARKTDCSGDTTACGEAGDAQRGKVTGPSEDDHRQGARAKVSRGARASTGRAIADSSTAERKVRQQVEQRRKESKQVKVQNWRERLI